MTLDDLLFKVLPEGPYSIFLRTADFFQGRVKSFFQKVFRKSHTSDREIWNFGYAIAPYMYRKLKAFVNADRIGCPGTGKYSGEDGFELWHQDLEEMLFAFEFLTIQELPVKHKKRKAFFEKIGKIDFEAEVEVNKKPLDMKGMPNFYYYNLELEQELYRRAEKALILFGTHYLNLWD